ncbi:hypothetical protein [Ferrovibrio sp.]|uniref:hypothetical protein n=1 Tax=Ferrovibrio sp. TaxID=1917215 RepID=UPI00311E52DD
MAKFVFFQSTISGKEIAVNPTEVLWLMEGGVAQDGPFTNIKFGGDRGVSVYGALRQVATKLAVD